MDNGMHYSGLGGRMITLCRPITSMPVFAKAGAIIPMANYTDNRLSNGEDIDVLVFPGADNTFVLYEDAGDGNDYENGAFCQTKMQLLWGAQAQFVIGPACGQRGLIPAARKWNIHLRGFHKSATVKVTVDGTVAEVFCRYAPQTNSTIVTLQASTASCICLEISGDARIHDNADWLDRCASIINAAEITYHAKEQLWDALTMSFENVHRRLAHLNFTCTDRESRRILPALKEMLTLTQEEY